MSPSAPPSPPSPPSPPFTPSPPPLVPAHPHPILADRPDMPTGRVPGTPTYRPRSDTVLTDSSASSLPSSILQTPQTPSILGVLASPPAPQAEGDDDGDATDRKHGYGAARRKLSYGFGSTSSIPALPSTTAPSNPSQPRGDSDPRTLRVDGPRAPFVKDADGRDVSSADGPALGPPEPTPSTPGAMDLDAVSAHLAEFPFPLASPFPPGPDETATPGGSGARSRSLKQLVRRRVDRSRSSLRSLALSRGRGEMDESDGEGDQERREAGGGGGSASGGRTIRRLRSFISLSLSRSGSSLSLRSNTSISTSSTVPSAPPSASTLGPAPLAPASTPTDGGAAPAHPPLPARLGLIDETDVGLPMIRTKGKTRAAKRSLLAPRPSSLRPALPSSTSASLTPISAKQGIIARPPPRSVSSPLPCRAEERGAGDRTDLFGSMLPRELRVLVLRSLLALWDAEPGNGRWAGAIGGRRELIKLSRVSKSWRSLCLDGQLWSTVDLTPFAAVLPPATFARIVRTTAPFITALSVRGMDALRGSVLLDSLGPAQLPGLVEMDLRGCKRITESQLIDLVHLAPHVRALNLKGVQSTTAGVLRSIADSSARLESLDVSRCWDLSLADLAVFLHRLSPEQAARYKVLRVAGLKAYGPTASDLLPTIATAMTTLRTLDMGGCTRVRDEDWRRWRRVYDAQASTAPLEHLVISGCTELTTKTLEHLTDVLPLVRSFEMAGLPEMFRHAADNAHAHEPLEELLRSMPRLEKLDLEGTGQFGGINDRVLRALIPAKQRARAPSTQGGIGGGLRELRLGFAKHVTAEELIHLIRGLEHLKVLEVDNTLANDAVMREFHHRRLDPSASISLIDCRAVSPSAYFDLATSSRPRMGFSGHAAAPFGYETFETAVLGRGVLKTFWSWKRVAPPKLWREALAEAEEGKGKAREGAEGSRRGSTASGGAGVGEGQGGAGGARGMRRRGSWWTGDRDEEDDRSCVVM